VFSLSALGTTLLVASAASAATLTVGPSGTYSTPCAAIAAASTGDTVQVSPGASSYTDSCAINVDGLTLVGVGGRPVIDLSGTQDPADDKGIYVVNGSGVTIENLELTGANVDLNDGLNGAALRVQGTGLTVRDCYIHDNQDGILATATAAGSTITVEYTEFSHNGLGAGCDNGGCTHNIYLGTGAGGDFETFVFAFNWSHDIADDTADKGHLVKTRAQNNYILYNALLGETGHDSIELDIPNGGFSVVVGNILEKGPSCDDNPNLLSYGEEGLSNPEARLYVVNNTFVSDYTSAATFISVASGAALVAHNNLFNGSGTPISTGTLSPDNLWSDDPMFVAPTTYDYHLQAGSPAIGQGVAPGSAGTFSLTPEYEYVQPTESVVRAVGSALDLGAFQYGTVVADAGQTITVSIGDGGTPSLPDAGAGTGTGTGTGKGTGTGTGTGAGTGSESGSAAATGATHGASSGASHRGDAGTRLTDGGRRSSVDASSPSSGSSGGCSCSVGAPASTFAGLWAGLVIVAQAFARRRRAQAERR
jgi:MYXO-CTERM domain-containing protein